MKKYDESVSSEPFPMITQTQLYPNSNNSGFVTKALEFDFPYYDSSYSSVTVHVDGYLMFDEQLYPYPYFIDDMNLFKITRHISPFMCHAIRLYSSVSDGIWYEGDDTQATFRWKASINEASTTTDINMAVRLYPNGNIEFLYGDIVIGDEVLWVPGLCNGETDDIQFSSFYFDDLPDENSKYTYERYNYPDGLSVSEDGLISGTLLEPTNGETMTFKLTDNNFVYDIKTLHFYSEGIQIVDSISSGGDEQVDYGEMASLSFQLTNLEGFIIEDALMNIICADTNITLLDDHENIGDMQIGQVINLENAFSFQIAPDIPDGHLIEIETNIEGNAQSWENTFYYIAHAAVIDLIEVMVDDGDDGRLDPGETADLIVRIKNSGSSNASVLNSILSTDDPLITINQSNFFTSILQTDSSTLLTYNISVDPAIPIGHNTTFNIDINGNMGYKTTLSFDQRIGLTLEDFETGDFHLFSWGFDGDRNWIMDETYPYEGDFCARSGNISHKQVSTMILDVEVLETGNISFFRKVSCEDVGSDDADFLSFYIDEVEQARWDGILSWDEVSFAVESGYHRFKWKYTKDSTVSEGLDAAFIDYISLPSCTDMNPHLNFNPDLVDKIMRPGEEDIDTLIISNPMAGSVDFSIMVSSVTDASGGEHKSIEGSYLDCTQKEFHSGEPYSWSFTLYNGSGDDEWLQELSIQLPEGIEVQSASNFSGGSSGDLVFTGSFGNGPLLNWYGEDASGWGVVHGGEYAYGEFSGIVDAGFTGDATLEYVIKGDEYGQEPHIIEGEINLTNLGGNVPWISCNVYEGAVNGQDQEEIMLTYNTVGLEDGDYNCKLIVRDNFQHETIIPIHLLVDTYLSNDELMSSAMEMEVFPNPFSDETNVMLKLSKSDIVSIRITDIKGRTVAVLAEGVHLPSGNHSFKWYPGLGSTVENGMYFVIVEYGNERLVSKIIRY